MSLSFSITVPLVRETSGVECRRPEDVVRELSDIGRSAQECFVILTLDTKYRLIDRHLISLGLLDSCLVHPREVFRPAITDNASAVVLCHNHPSGDPTPSNADMKITRQMIDASRILQIDLLDHIIIGRTNDRRAHPYFSLRESGMIQFGE